MKASVELISMKATINSAKAYIASMKASMEAFVEVTSLEAFVKAFVEAPVEVSSAEASMKAVRASSEDFMSFHAKCI